MLKSFSLEKKVGYSNFRSKTQVHERCFFLMKWNVICNAEDIFHVLEHFCRVVMLELQCTKSLVRASKNTNALFSATKQRRESKTDAEKLSLSERKFLCNYKSKAQVHERCFFSWNEMLFAKQKDIFSCFRALLHITSLEFRAFWKASFSVRESWFMQF